MSTRDSHATSDEQSFDAGKVRALLLEIIDRESRPQNPVLQATPILNEVVNELKAKRDWPKQQLILTVFYDLFRTGVISFGFDVDNAYLPCFHLTDRGRETLKHASRDPSNPDGYLTYLESKGSVDPIARSYVDEALRTYNSNCYRAAAVMIGAATERIVHIVAEELIEGFKRRGVKPPKQITDWKYKTMRDGITGELSARSGDMPPDLFQAFSAYWLPATEQPRTSRNDAGHPVNIDPVTVEEVHSSLLTFPGLIGLATRLISWIKSHYQ